MEQLNREVRQNGYKTKNNIILIQHGHLKARIMIEVEKQDKYDAQIHTYSENTSVDTMVFREGTGSFNDWVKRMKERIFARRTMEIREIYYWKVPSSAAKSRVVLFGLT